MFSQLSDGLDGVFKKLKGQGKLSEKNVADAMREVRMALLEADVDFNVAKDFIARVKEEALGEKVLKSITPGQQIVKVFQDALVDLLGGDAVSLDLNPPARILMCGLNGSGKTTTSGKLALRLKKEGRKPLLIACDLYRPAAVEQLATLAAEIEVPVYKPEPGEKNLVKVAKKALAWAEAQSGNVLIFDTAGRQEIDTELVKELQKLSAFIKPKETLLVADAATGQGAVSVATHFDEAVGITGIVLTKLDGDARGGAALSMRQVTGKPIKFVGEGEKLADLDAFVPGRMAERILGMGDVVGLVEKASEAIDEKAAMKMAERMKKAQFDFNDFLAQMKMINGMSGGLGGLMKLMPGAGKLKGLADAVDDKKMKRVEAIVLAMTPKERSRPELLNGRRRARIAKGSGNSIVQVNQFLKQFGMMRKMMKNKGKMKQMMKQMGGMDMGGMGGNLPPGMKF
jgi:signal recognition particle subunit SRP54